MVREQTEFSPSNRGETLRRFGLQGDGREGILDRITALAARLFAVPISVVTLVDDTHQFVKAAHGIERAVLPRSLSFCNRLVVDEVDMLIVPDLRLDARFGAHPFVLGEPHLRFYAGVALVSADGERLGALCILDYEPRTLDASEVDLLAQLSALAMEHLELRRRNSEANADRNRVRAVFDASPVAIATVLENGTVTSWNDAAEALFGWSRHEVVGRRSPTVPPESSSEYEHLREVARTGRIVRGHRTSRVHRDGSRVEIELSVAPVRDARGVVAEIVLMYVNVSKRVRAQAIERNRHAILELAANGAPLQQLLDRIVSNVEAAVPGTIGSLLRVRDGRLYHAASGAAMLPAYVAAVDGSAIGATFGSCGAAAATGEILIAEDVATHPNWVEYRELALSLGLRACWSIPIRSGTQIVGTLATYAREPRTPTPTELQSLVEAAHAASIVFQSHGARVLLEEMALSDVLTGLPNRRLFEDRLEHAIARAKRSGKSVALGVLDLDRFKVINDTLGHAVGDALLREVASRLQRCMREGDTVARMGGDEFLILLPEIDGPDVAREVASRVRESLATVFAPEGNELFVRASIGFSVFPNDAIEPSQLLRLADRSMYDAKRAQTTIAFCDASAPANDLSELQLETSLNHALEKGELELVYQPILACADWSTYALEALLRWNHPLLGTLAPDRFIRLAEETGLIIPIGKWVLREACRFSRRWSDAGGSGRVGVNVSPRQFEDRAFFDSVVEALEESGIEPDALVLEVTETLIMRSPETTAALLQQLRSIGVLTSIDDFGSGYSSLNYLKRFPIDAIKIDRSFVAEIGEDGAGRSDEAIVGAIVGVGNALDVMIVAEGVETERQALFVRATGCQLAQGFYFARPMRGPALLERGNATFRGGDTF